jgi:hypothetical protein
VVEYDARDDLFSSRMMSMQSSAHTTVYSASKIIYVTVW